MEDAMLWAVGGLSCLLVMAALVIVAVVVVMYRQQQANKPAPGIRAPVNTASRPVPPTPVAAPPPMAPNLPAQDDFVPEDELPTVVVSQPPPLRPQSLDMAPMPTPTRRTSGATIIAFDDDDDDDDE